MYVGIRSLLGASLPNLIAFATLSDRRPYGMSGKFSKRLKEIIIYLKLVCTGRFGQ